MDEQHRVVRTRVPISDDLFVFGTGHLVAPGRVLTARHVLAAEGRTAEVGQLCQVRVWPCGPDQAWVDGAIAWLHPSEDVGIVGVEGLGADLTALDWGAVEGPEPIQWSALGYPVASLEEDDRVEEGVFGRLAPGVGRVEGTARSDGRVARAVEGALGNGGWEGLSGAAVFSGSRLVGIITADPVVGVVA